MSRKNYLLGYYASFYYFCGTHKVNLLLSYLEDNSKVALLTIANKTLEVSEICQNP